MFELKKFYTVQTLDQADELLHKDKKNVILGGLLWMRMGNRQFHTGIDLSSLGLDQISDLGDRIEIGAMTCLRTVETSELLRSNFGPVLSDAVSSIVGVQFRNLATVGGSVYSRFGFSDLITALLILDTRVHLYRGGEILLVDFLEKSPGRDILVKLTIPKQKIETCYQSFRKTATDFPVLVAAIGKREDTWKIAVGARPARARLALEAAAKLKENPEEVQIEDACQTVTTELGFGSNQRGSKFFREHLARVLVKRGVKELCC